ncbi:RagB/SusD family nutrient uptake outer membrane protein [Chitinophaga sedimenti]|uniref:RagB/SusD family nutrient uptake outer membrane protein n=1 Tax=Chitinophaga sedimenti TaxID=2033606 RepID=UPI00200492DE|nr:RagB/SusD family nutrient uptake outer membrane protein [Chitinophaga sedimenti]MCK7558335.1 RagB/SusD family nutrient uptake outer membrane protein [Chitinophaga sedimenti]
MKKIWLIGAAVCSVMTACTDLDVPVESELTSSNFPTTQEGFAAASGPAYTQLASIYAVEYWRMQELSTDEAIIPARGGNYNDGGQYRDLHKHTWTADHTNINGCWKWGYSGINKCNSILVLFERAPDGAAKQTALAEIRVMRAFFHFLMMDLYGNVPIITKFGATETPKQSTRAEVFTFIEKELKEALPDLNDGPTTAKNYARPTKSMVFALLTKMYLNAPQYAAKTMYPETVAMADSVLKRTYFSLDGDYMSIFAPENGPQIKETIFAVPYDPNYIKGNHFTRFGLHTSLQAKYSIPFRPSIALSTIASFYQKFNLPNDTRNATWLAGKQFDFSGAPINITTTKKGLDQTMPVPTVVPRSFGSWSLSRNLPWKMCLTWTLGTTNWARHRECAPSSFILTKMPIHKTVTRGNDFPVLRLADVMLMKAEAILRGAAPTVINGEMQTADVLVTKIRTRAKTTAATGVTLNDLLEERAREMAWEGWRRNDLIRFGKFEDKWGFKDNDESYRRLYPIPNNEIVLSGGNLTQNTGYIK